MLSQETTRSPKPKPTLSNTNLSRSLHSSKDKLARQTVLSHPKPVMKPRLSSNFPLEENMTIDVKEKALEAVEQCIKLEFTELGALLDIG